MKYSRRLAFVLLLTLACGAFVGCSKDVKIGAVIAESGAVAPYGKTVRRGLELALEEVNASGGFNGGLVEISFRDDKSDPDEGEAAVLDLIENEGVDMIIGAISSEVALKIAPICQEKRVLMLSPTASSPLLTDAGEYVFRNYPSDILEGTSMADFARRIGLRNVVVFQLDNQYGDGLREVFTRRFESKSRRVVERFRVEELNTEASPDQKAAYEQEIAELVGKAKKLNPDGIYLITYVHETAALVKQIHAAKLKTVVLSTGAYTPELPKLAGDAAENLVYPQPNFDVESQEPEVASFVAAYRARYDEDPDIYAAHGYDALKLLMHSMEVTGSKHHEDVKRGLLGIEGFLGAAGRTAFDENGDVVRYPRLFIVRQGAPLAYDIFAEQGGELPVTH